MSTRENCARFFTFTLHNVVSTDLADFHPTERASWWPERAGGLSPNGKHSLELQTDHARGRSHGIARRTHYMHYTQLHPNYNRVAAVIRA